MDAQTGYYHKNTLKNSRAAINRHLNDIGRSVDIVRDKEYKTANQALDGMLNLEHQDPQNTKRSSIQRTCQKFLHIYGQPSSLPWFYVSVYGTICPFTFRISGSWISPSAVPQFLQLSHRWKRLRICHSSTRNPAEEFPGWHRVQRGP